MNYIVSLENKGYLYEENPSEDYASWTPYLQWAKRFSNYATARIIAHKLDAQIMELGED